MPHCLARMLPLGLPTAARRFRAWGQNRRGLSQICDGFEQIGTVPFFETVLSPRLLARRPLLQFNTCLMQFRPRRSGAADEIRPNPGWRPA